MTEIDEFGNFIAIFHTDWSMQWARISRFSIALFCGAGIFFIILANGLTVTLAELILGGIPLMYAFVMCWRLWRSWGKQIKIYVHGFLSTTKGKSLAIRWTEIESISPRFPILRQSIVYNIRLHNGELLHIDMDYEHFEPLVYILYERSIEAFMEIFLDRFTRGDSQVVGSLTFSQEGIQQGEQFIPYDDIDSWLVGTNSITIRRKSPSMIIETRGRENAYIIPHLLNALLPKPNSSL
jgi:hypothetical protein